MIFKVGSFTKSTGAAPASQSVAHGLGVTPKAIILWTSGGLTAGSFRQGFYNAIGFLSGTSEVFSVSTSSQDGVGTSNSSKRQAAKALTIIQWSEALQAECDLSSWDATNFTLNWTTNNSAAYIINFIAIAGDEVQAKVVSWQANTAVPIDISVTGVGFKPDCVMHMGITNPSAPPNHQSFCEHSFGAMTLNGDQWACGGASEEAVGTSDTGRVQRTNKCHSVPWPGGILDEANFKSMDSDGFTVTFTLSSSLDYVFSLCLKGIRIKLGSFDKSTGGGPASQAVTGIGFKPKGLMLVSFNDVAQSTQVPHNRFGIGAADGSNERASAHQDADGLATTSVEAIGKTDKCFVKVNNDTPAIDAEADLSSFDDDGFTLSWSTNDAVATQMLFAAFGQVSSLVYNPRRPMQSHLTR